MSINLTDLVKAAVSQVSTDDERPLAKANLEALEAGVGVNPRDMTPTERRKRKQRQIDNDRRSRAARREREVRLNSYTDKPKRHPKVETERLAAVYKRVIAPMRRVIEDTARAKAVRISRHMGPFEVEDVVSDAMERIALAFAKYDIEVDDMAKVAKDMRGRKSLPRDLDGLAQIMAQTINIQAKKATSQWWRDNPTLTSIEYLSTLEHNSAGEDSVLDKAAADGDLNIVGWRPPRPGGVDPAMIAHILHGILTARKLHDVADMILGMEEDEDGNLHHRTTTDGNFLWYRYSKPLWLACGLSEDVYRKIPKDKRAAAVRKAVENRFMIVQEVMERAYALLSEHEDGLSDHLHQYWVPKITEAEVSQAPTDDEAELIAALKELLNA